ncbi:hypothetical protein Dsin_017375 [Dipteronia sinensis]|uniref:Uncharacterized protein n=1 Tax=Dipteronia sinensis TaxID=43782 RepID=A0AAE0AF72_9ROSI|nr:hypothetical protein Dsin_017375 [Dipteronia sinensis]
MDWIDSILNSSLLLVLINGVPEGYFFCSRGVRQRDLLSPILFGIAEDFLSRLLTGMGPVKRSSWSMLLEIIVVDLTLKKALAMLVSFRDQIRVCWKEAIHAVVWSVLFSRNQWIFKGKLVDFRLFGLRGRPARTPVIKSVIWLPPAPGWIKVNTDGAALSSPGVEGYGGVFRNFRAFVKGCFVIPLGQMFTFKADFLRLLWPLSLLGSMYGVGYGLRVILLIWFSCSLLALSRFLSKFIRRDITVFSRFRRWILRCPIFSGRGIRLWMPYLNMLWSWRQILSGSPLCRSVPRLLAMTAWAGVFMVFLMLYVSF